MSTRSPERAPRLSASDSARGGRLSIQFVFAPAPVQGMRLISWLALVTRHVRDVVQLRLVLRWWGELPPLVGWAIAPDVAIVLVRRVLGVRPPLIVEFGSGSSTVILGLACRRAGVGRVVSIEHDEAWAAHAARPVARWGLESVVSVRVAALVEQEVSERRVRWYDTRALDDLAHIGLLFVDGPPGSTGPLARWPVVPVLLPRLSAGCIILLDDALREDERATLDMWAQELGAELNLIKTRVGLGELRVPDDTR